MGVVVIARKQPSTHLDTSPRSEPTLELHSRAVDGPDTERNSGGRRIKKISIPTRGIIGGNLC